MANLASLFITILTKSNTSGLEKTDRAIRKTKTSLKGMQKDIGLLSGLSRKLFGGINLNSLIDAGGKYLQFEKDLGAIHSRFFAITQDEQKATEEFNYIRKVAIDTANDINKTAESYSIFYSATAKALGKEGARGVFEDWTRVGRVLHLSEYQMERVTYALREMASKGAIYSQDLRMQIGTHVPNAMGLAQKASEEMGFTGNDWFEKLQKSAKGNAKITTEFVQRFSKQARQMFGNEEAFKKAMQQPDALAKQITNLGQEAMIQFSQSGGSYMVIKVLEGVLNAIKIIPFDRITSFLGNIAHVVGDLFNFLSKHTLFALTLLSSILGAILVTKNAESIRNTGAILGGLFGFGTKGKFALKGLLSGSAGIIGQAFARQVLKSGIKATLLKLLGFAFGGPLGIAINIFITAMPLLLTLIRKIAKVKEDKETGKKDFYFGKNFLDTGYSTDTVRKGLENIAKNGILSRDDLIRQLNYRGLSNLTPYVDVDTQNNIHVFIDGKDIPFSQITSEENNKKRKKGKIPAKPNKFTQDKLRKLGI